MARWLALVLILCNPLVWSSERQTPEGRGPDKQCPLAQLPPPSNRRADFIELLRGLKKLDVSTRDEELYMIFHNEPPRTKLEQFFRLLYYIQKDRAEQIPLEVTPPGITEILLAAKVFTDPSFPNRIQKVELDRERRFTVFFDAPEVRFPLNSGVGFAVYEHGKCQWARELIFYNGFGFRLREKKRNLIAEDFGKVQLFGDFGARHGPIKIDLSYVDLERVEFIDGTDQGIVKSRVADREFKSNPHSFLFRWIGPLIPDSSRQRIDW
ncbi:MAG: hypothetical protein HYW02_00450 [Deltaproteobacteria bacterium]|nr:hypothetical protein [Deltaproteobacteria bacterium]MBI4197314.1 hypothetical protein [Deltaproteobacteria bacterium]